MADFAYSDLLPTGEDTTTYRKLTSDGVRTLEGPGGRTFLEVDPSALETLSATAMHDIAHYLRTSHLAQLRKILDDPEASNNDKFVALDREHRGGGRPADVSGHGHGDRHGQEGFAGARRA